MLLLKLSHFKSGAAAISPEKRVFQAAAGIRSRGRRSDCRFQQQTALAPDESPARREKRREWAKTHAFWRMIFIIQPLG